MFFTLHVKNYRNMDDPDNPTWDNMGKEIVPGIDDKAEPAGCKKDDIKWGETAK